MQPVRAGRAAQREDDRGEAAARQPQPPREPRTGGLAARGRFRRACRAA